MWIESHQSIRNHPKVKKAARLAGISEPEMIGRLHYLWWWALDYAPDGDVTKYSAEDIESAVDWAGDVGRFYKALLECGFNGHCGLLEMIEDSIFIHDWHEYGGRLLEKREANAERMRVKRALHVQRTAIARTGATEQTEQTEQYNTEQTEQNQPSGAAKPRSSAQQAHDAALDMLIDIFAQWTSIPKPNGNGPKGVLATRWYAPLNRLWSLCGKDSTASAELMKSAIERMREEKLNISAPQSIEKVAVSIFGENGSRQNHGKNIAADWERALKR